MTSQTVLLILEKINNRDKDFRYMATSDLLTELGKDGFRVDGDMERKMCAAVLNQLEDPSGDISGLAVKCMSLLVRRVSEARALETVKSLCDKAITPAAKKEKEQQRDVASICLKTMITELQAGSLAVSMSVLITSKMLEGLTKDNADVAGDAMDTLAEVVTRFGGVLGGEHARIRDALLPTLDDTRTALRKRALYCLAAMSVYLNDEMLSGVINSLLSRLKKGGLKSDVARTYLQAVGQISRTVGYRFGRFLAEAIPMAITYCQSAAESDDELRDYCLQALESFMKHAPAEAQALVPTILPVLIKFLKYDPNYADDDGMEEDGDEGEAEDEEDEMDDDEGFSDDEDMSWKVRRAAAKALAALITAFPDALPALHDAAGPELVTRFREREESVRGDVFAAYIALMRQVGAVSKRFAPSDTASPVVRLQADMPGVVRALARQLKQRSIKSRVGAFQVLREAALVCPADVAEHVALVLPGISDALKDKNTTASTLKIEALLFTRFILGAGPQGAAANPAHLAKLLDAVLPCVADRYFKVSAEGLRVLEQLLMVVRPLDGAPAPLDKLPLAKLFSALHERLRAQDQDQEVKEAAISTTATAAARCADLLGPELPELLRLLLDRLRNEITRLASVRAFSVLAASPLPLDLAGAGVLDPCLAELTTFLRKALRPLRLAALVALEGLSVKYGPLFSPAVVGAFMEEAAALICDADLALAAQALQAVAKLVRAHPAAGPSALAKALPPALILLRSPLLQGSALLQLQELLPALAASGAPGADVDSLLRELLSTVKGVGSASSLPRSAHVAVAQCVAVLASMAGPAKVASLATSLLVDVAKPPDVGSQRLALLCLGELGRRADLSKLPQVEAAITSSLALDSEEIKGAASLALGGVACGNLSHYMPSLIRQIKAVAGSRQQYLLLTALTEVVATIALPSGPQATTPQLSPADQAQVMALLMDSVEGSQEECRLVVAECLGRLALLYPLEVLSQLQTQLSSKSPSMRAVVVSSLKYMVVERLHPVDVHLASAVLPMLRTLADSDRHVRRAAVVSLSALAHQKAGLVVSAGGGVATSPLQELLPHLYAQTEIRADMVRIVDLGPFKHKIDDGLELRKAAFECLDILLDSPVCRGLLEWPTFLGRLQSGLGDHVDVKVPCHLMLAKLCSVAPGAVLNGAEKLVGPLEGTLTTKLKSDAVKQEADRHEDMLRGVLRGVAAIAALPGVEACPPFQAFMRRIVLTTPIKEKYLLVEKERQESGDHMETM